MSVRMRHTKGQRGSQRAHQALAALSVVKDTETGKLRLPHRLDEATGMYNGKQIVTAPEKKAKEPQAKKEKHEHAHDHTHDKTEKEKGSKGFLGRLMNSRPKARSGAGGGGA